MLITLLVLVYTTPLILSLASLAWIQKTNPESFDDFPILFRSEFKTPHESDFSRRFIVTMFMFGACVPIANWFELGYMVEWFVVQYTYKLKTQNTLAPESDSAFPVLSEVNDA
ncbi:hypothetical protein [Spirosoma aerophilum]